jgi:ribonucleoside-diphosphate reductase alpha chain
MYEPSRPSPFIDLAAVEAWDAWFRWRQGKSLRDFSIEGTWRRVSSALASVEARAARERWQARFIDALVTWRLLPDERLVMAAGTGRITWGHGPLHAVVNAAAFVRPGSNERPTIDLEGLRDTAILAVRMLDDAALLAGVATPRLRIGLAGVADALALLGPGYDSEAGRNLAGALGTALAEGCLRGSVELAAARGDTAGDMYGVTARAVARGMPPDLLKALMAHGARHEHLTAITSQCRLALLANDIADALDPLRGENHPNHIVAASGPRMIRSSGYALNLLRARDDTPPAKPDTLAHLSCKAQIAMRAALQPWIDEPIGYPILAMRGLGEVELREARREAVSRGFDAPTFRDPAAVTS